MPVTPNFFLWFSLREVPRLCDKIMREKFRAVFLQYRLLKSGFAQKLALIKTSNLFEFSDHRYWEYSPVQVFISGFNHLFCCAAGLKQRDERFALCAVKFWYWIETMHPPEQFGRRPKPPHNAKVPSLSVCAASGYTGFVIIIKMKPRRLVGIRW